MPSFRRILRSLRSLHIQNLELPAATPSVRNGIADRSIRHIGMHSADLSLMLANFTGSFKGLPQEIVDEILEYLENDRRTLRACSLTCKGLFRSTRRIIHRQLYLVGPGKAATSNELELQRREIANRSQLGTLSLAAERGLAHYTRELTIRVGEEFTPDNLQSYLPQFQTFARLTSLSLHYFNPTPFLPVFKQYFGHLAQQMRSLEFIYPPGPQDDMMYFISQFPNLDDLGFNSFPQHNLEPSKEYNILSIRTSPALRGTLKVTSTNTWRTNSLEYLTRLPSGLRFRSIEFLHCTRINPGILIRECTSTLQSLTHVFHTYGAVLRFDLSACSRLRTFEFRLELSSYIFRDLVSWLASVISTITSPVFSRFVLVASSTNFHPLFRRANGRSAWELADQALLRLSQQTGMKMIARRRILHDSFCNALRDSFPLMVSAGAFEFETSDSSSCTHYPVSWPVI